MTFHPQQAGRALILLGFSVLLYMMHTSGEILLFINPKYLLLSQAAAFLFMILFFIQITRVWTVKESHAHDGCSQAEDCCSHNHDHGDSPFSVKKAISYSIIVFPLLTGFMLPAKVLDSSIADKKGAMLSIAGSSKNGNKQSPEEGQSIPAEDQQSGEDYIPEDDTAIVTGYENQKTEAEYNQLMKQLEHGEIIQFNDSIYSSYYEEISSDINKFQGRKVSLNGFVYKEDSFSDNQLVVSRFLVTHCVADASIIGFLSEFPDAAKIEKDSWIKIEGIIENGTYMDTPIPLVKVTNWEEVSEPESPYLYPISIKRN
ncbi:TIGR03943 family putative permease subunit [Mesobacillus subterraneus]|uniref:TIGR03943 family protein n=1 Tax=Mesobacillus subterraneus TaxID=285983 RepID=A0A3R9FIW7_9BACI|nr:TIGR03943 family protein [Mesobacillus subterraneus]RSD29093.1 TIGR03943 family protein [Mesobacillus subterraneus]